MKISLIDVRIRCLAQSTMQHTMYLADDIAKQLLDPARPAVELGWVGLQHRRSNTDSQTRQKAAYHKSYVIRGILIWLVFSLHSYCSCPLISLVIPQ
jgi:hypothetical protein